MTKVALLALLATAKIAAAPVYYKADILLTSAYRVLEWSRTPALFIHDEKHHEYHATGARDPGEGARPGGRSPHYVPEQAGPPGRPPEAGPGERVSRTPGGCRHAPDRPPERLVGTGASPDEGEQHAITKGKIEGDKITLLVEDEDRKITFDLVLAAERITCDVNIVRDGQTAKAKIDVTRAK